MAEVERKLAAILSADVVAYSRLLAALLHGAAMIKVVPSIDEDQAIG